MTKYLFECIECKEKEEKDIPMSVYDSEKSKQICSKCKGNMKRIIEFNGKVGLCDGMYGANGWNK